MTELPGGLGVEEVEVRELVPAVLDDLLPPARRPPAVAVAGAVLVGVLAVAERPDPLEVEMQTLGEDRPTPPASEESNQARIGVIGRGVGEGRPGEAAAGREGDRAPAALSSSSNAL